MKEWHRKDITTFMVLDACDRFHSKKDSRAPWEIIKDETGAPEKVIYAAMDREDSKYLDWGVSLRTAWLTDEGKAKLAVLYNEITNGN